MTARTLQDVAALPPIDRVPCPTCLRRIPLFEAVDVRDLPAAMNPNNFVCGACLNEDIRAGRLDADALRAALPASPLPASANSLTSGS